MSGRALLRSALPPAVLAARARVRHELWRRKPFARVEPFSPAYLAKRDERLADLLPRAAAGAGLDELGLLGNPAYEHVDERLVEYAWTVGRLAARGGGQRLLDVGCVLNQPAAAPILRRLFGERWYLNIAYEALHDHGRASMVCSDVRESLLPAAYFDAITCVSTLEHVGMDNTLYTGDAERASAASEPELWERARPALDEMRRLLRPRGILLLTVPFGTPEDRGWFHVFGPEEIARTCAFLGTSACTTSFFRLAPGRGWLASDADECAGLRYGDGVPAAAAVACLEFVQPD